MIGIRITATIPTEVPMMTFRACSASWGFLTLIAWRSPMMALMRNKARATSARPITPPRAMTTMLRKSGPSQSKLGLTPQKMLSEAQSPDALMISFMRCPFGGLRVRPAEW